MNEFTAESARQLADNLASIEKTNIENAQKKANAEYEEKRSLLGKKWVGFLNEQWENEVKKAISNKETRVELYRNVYFDIDRYIALNSKEVNEFCDKLKSLGFNAWTITWNTEDYGSRSDPDFYCEGRQEAYLIIDWSKNE